MGMLLPTAPPEADRAVLGTRVNRATSTQRDALRALIILTLGEHGGGRPPGWWAARPARWSNGGTAIGSAGWSACVICLVRVRRGSTAMSSAVGSPPRPPASRPGRGRGRGGPTPVWPSTSTPRRSRAAGEPLLGAAGAAPGTHSRASGARLLHRTPDPHFDERIAAIQAAVADARAGRRTCIDAPLALAAAIVTS